jgi:hypothetical protein
MLSSKRCLSLHKDTTPPQPNHTVTSTHIEPEQYNTWNKSTISRKLLKMDVLTFEACRAVNSEIIKQVTWSWSIFIQPKFLFQDLVVRAALEQCKLRLTRMRKGESKREQLATFLTLNLNYIDASRATKLLVGVTFWDPQTKQDGTQN